MSSQKPVYRFGPFRLDCGTRVLLLDGHPVPLRQKALEVLLALVESHGNLVEKQALMDKVWAGTFVEEGNLSFTIHLLRKALGDERNNGNRFVETVPRRGYRFVAKVEVMQGAESDNGDGGAAAPRPAGESRIATAGPGQAPGAEKPPSKRTLIAGAAIALLACAVTAVVLLAVRVRSGMPKVIGYTQLTFDTGFKSSRLFTDGRRIYFLEGGPGGSNSLVSILTSGGNPAALSTPLPVIVLFDLSSQRSELLVGTRASNGPALALWSLRVAGSQPRPLGNLAAESAAWSPDGKSLAYSNGATLFIAGGDGSDPRPVHTFPGRVEDVQWFRNGKQLRLTAEVPGREQSAFWDVDAEGTGARAVLPGWSADGTGIWSRDGRYYLFSWVPSEGEESLWAVRESASFFAKKPDHPFQLSSSHPLEIRGETLSADGQKVYAVGMSHRFELMRYDPRSGQFVSYLGGPPAYWAAFSQDGKRVAYLTLPQRTLWRANGDGSDPVQLTFPPLEGDGLAWSPDGKWIALRARMPAKPWKIYRVSSEGGAAEPLTQRTADEGIPSWSPDAQSIVYGDVPAVFGQDDGHHRIHILEVQSRRVSDLPGSTGLWTARWSPDGRYIAALEVATGRIRLFDFRSHTWRPMGPLRTDNLTWSPDGRYLYFNATGEEHWNIERQEVNNGQVQSLVTGQQGFPNLRWAVGVTPEGSPIVTAEIGFAEIYALDLEWP